MKTCVLARTLMLATLLWVLGGCASPKAGPGTSMVWRASNDYGDKPGNGIELVLANNVISGTFFLLEPEQPHNFEAGLGFPMQMVERKPREFLCQIRYNASQTDQFVLRLPPGFPQNRFVAETHETTPGSAPIQFRFERVSTASQQPRVIP